MCAYMKQKAPILRIQHHQDRVKTWAYKPVVRTLIRCLELD